MNHSCVKFSHVKISVEFERMLEKIREYVVATKDDSSVNNRILNNTAPMDRCT